MGVSWILITAHHTGQTKSFNHSRRSRLLIVFTLGRDAYLKYHHHYYCEQPLSFILHPSLLSITRLWSEKVSSHLMYHWFHHGGQPFGGFEANYACTSPFWKRSYTSGSFSRGSTELTLARYSYVPHKCEGEIIDGRVQTIAWIWLVPQRPSP